LNEARQPVEAFFKALEENDLDRIAQIAGFEGWNELQADRLKTMNDPNHQRMKKMERELREKNEAAEREKREFEARKQQDEQQRKMAAYRQGLSQKAAESKDSLAKAMHDDPLFINTIMSLQRDLIDPLTGKTVSLEQALDYELPNGKTLRKNLQERYQRLHGVFGTKGAPPEVSDPSKLKGTVKKNAPVVATTKKKVKVTKESLRRDDEESDNDLIAKFARQMDVERKKESRR
jgi:hypothetical protein